MQGKFIRRYKRFLVDIELDDGTVITAHCANTGRMTGCAAPGWPVLLTRSDNAKRRLEYSLEMTYNGTCWIGVNTGTANAIVANAIQQGDIPELAGYESLKREVTVGSSRIDIVLEGCPGAARCLVEVKSVTMLGQDGSYQFPDAVTVRGQKHLATLAAAASAGERAVLFYLIRRSDGSYFKPAAEIDADYARAVLAAKRSGVEILAWRLECGPDEPVGDLPQRIDCRLT